MSSAHPFLPNLDTSAALEHVLTTAPRGRSPTLGDGWRRQRLLSALVLLLLLCGAAPVARCAEATAGEAARGCSTAAGGGETDDGGRSEFPVDVFSQQQRQRGWVVLHFAGTAYALALLAIVCQKYFVPSLEVMADYFRVPTDVAGATFMAMGTSAPELFSSVFGLFVSEGDIGVSTVLGSAVFNIVGVTGVIGLIIWKKTVDISWYPVTRDCIMFAVTVLALVVIVWDNSVAWWEALIMLLMFILYIVYMSFDSHISKWSQRKVDKLKMFRRFTSISTATLKPANENTPLLATQTIVYVEQCREKEGSSGSDTLLGSSSVSENENVLLSGHVRKLETGETCGAWSMPPDGSLRLLGWLLVWPGLLLMGLTIPDCRQPRFRNWFPVTFVVAIVWVGLLSYFTVWMVTVIGDTFAIPETVSGITLLAVGTSMPEAITSVIVARNGLGNMALCNLLGSNVFDILFCLGAPWLVKAAFFSPDQHRVLFSSAGVSFSAAVLLTLVLLLYLFLAGFRWKLDLRIGIACSLLYTAYIVFACMYEMNVFGVVNTFVCL
ncbi:sodium/potassium/calcium exchanger 5-like [Dermacentor variabilis]|uniref:sodium/potassium/calcium exchanger 5-like n=1 Tax=Dermacentor variabilis TaxID=34621 RepID=UPI003F5B796C